ncbi:MAG: hypothetical protein ACOVS5_16980 [Oligoflexus sp.]|jgi:hypothetical protein
MNFKVQQLSSLVGSLTLSALVGCGTQIGNPTGTSQVRLLTDVSSLQSAVTGAFLQTVDGLNMGDYAYSNSESRVVSLRQCQGREAQGLALVQKTASSHSVEDDNSKYFARSDVTIERSYQDSWFQASRQLPCDTTIGVKFPYESLNQADLRLESTVSEVLQRSTNLTYKTDEQAFKHSLMMQKSGKRTLDLVSFEEKSREIALKALLDNRLTSKIELLSKAGMANSKVLAEMQLIDTEPMPFEIVLDRSSLLWQAYKIDRARQEFVLDGGERLRLDFSQVVFTRAGGCTPASGELTVTVSYDGALPLVYQGRFVEGQPLTLRSDDGSLKPILLAPFACVLKER